VKYPEIGGKICRALPYEKDSQSRSTNGCLFVKGFGKDWTHKQLNDLFIGYGEIVSCKVSINEDHGSRGYGFIQFAKIESSDKALSEVILMNHIIFYG
jgi:polyadenylate-binding protein